jgi:SAM-dependent methyltransferase
VNGFAWTCPRCDGSLLAGGTRWVCRGCGATFRALRGVPDLRVRDDPYLANEEDWRIACQLDAAFDRCDFRRLLDHYYDLAGDTTPAQCSRQIQHILTAPGRVARWRDAQGRVEGTLLDLGCGSGSFLSAIGEGIPMLAGVDIAMRWLIVARKRLDEEGLSAIPLACACAERLPIGAGRVEGIVAGDVFEHVADQRATLDEAHRVLRPGGRMFLASPNRFSLAPEPHVGLWGVGYLPRRLMGPYVRIRRRGDFRAIHTLGIAEWERMLKASPFATARIEVPPPPSEDLAHFGAAKRLAARVYNRVVTTRLGQRLARRIGPLFHVTVVKANASTPIATSPAIRPRSRRSIVPR